MSPLDDPHISPGEVADYLDQQVKSNPKTYCALCPRYLAGVGVSSRNTIRQPAPRHPVSCTVNPSRVCCAQAAVLVVLGASAGIGSI
jgi:hypothetical protein